jgi:hypothetical protein
MTEEDAKTKWCCGPQIIAATLVVLQGDPRRVELTPDAGHCIASACMAWRWRNDYERRWDLPADKPPEGAGWQRVEATDGVAHWVRQNAAPDGFCGLAGAPQ